MCVKDVKLIKIGTLTIEAFERPDSNLVAMKYFVGWEEGQQSLTSKLKTGR